jgi:parvulin-like peptidyl-prolyl isomerase
MNMNNKKIKALWGAMLLGAMGIQAAEGTKPAAPRPAFDAKSIFPDDTLCKGKGIEIKRSQVDEAFIQYKANLTARGQALPEGKRDLAESQLLDRLVVTKLLVNRATDEDKKKARTAADKFVASTKQQAGSDESFQRQLSAMNFTVEQFDAQVLERAICEEVVDRELRSQVNITDEQLKKFYDENGQQFERPESVRAAHIMLSTRDPVTGQELSEGAKKERKQQIEKLLERAKQGEEFAALAKEYSDDPGSKKTGGEYTFARGQFRNPEFEGAAFALQTNQISGVVTTAFGYHIIKLYEKMPAQKLELAKVKDDLKDGLSRREVQEKLLPDYLKSLKKEANLQYLNGAMPPSETSDEKPAVNPVEKTSEKAAVKPDRK